MPQPIEHALDVTGAAQLVIDLDVGQLDQRQVLLVDKIIQGQDVAQLGEMAAGSDDLRCGAGHPLQDFNDDLGFGKGRGDLLHEEIFGEVDETGAVAGNLFDTFGEKGGGEQTGGGPITA